MRPISLFFTTLLVASLPAAASDALKRCRSIPDAVSRLACYDALPVDEPKSAPRAPVAASPAPSAAPGAAATARPAPPMASAPAPDARTGAPSSVPGLEAGFGLEGRAPAAELPAIESHIPGTFLGWSQYSQIQLANGQVWQVVDESSRRMQLQDAKVRVRRGMMGAFYLEFEAHNHSPRVRRVQ